MLNKKIEVVFSEVNAEWISSARLTDTREIVAFRDDSNRSHGTAVVLDIAVDGTITPRSEMVFNDGRTDDISIARLTDTRAIVAFNDYFGGGTAIVLDIAADGTITQTIDEHIFNKFANGCISIARLTDTRAIVAYSESGAITSTGVATVLELEEDGTITQSSDLKFNEFWTNYISVSRLTDDRAIVAFRDDGNHGHGIASVLDIAVDGTISRRSEMVFNAARPKDISISRLSDTHAIVAFRDAGNSERGSDRVLDIAEDGTITISSEFVFSD